MSIKFPSINSQIACYTPSNFRITFNKIKSTDLPKIQAHPLKYHNHLSIIAHETRHYIDHISTLWGQEFILQHMNSINNYLFGDMKHYNVIAEYIKKEKQLTYTDYYTHIIDKDYRYIHGVNPPWGFELIIVLKYNVLGVPDKTMPLLCVSFTISLENRKRIARIPISIVSLLEVNAIHEEFKVKHNYIKSLSNDEQFLANKLFEKELLENLIYNQNLAIYNVIVHIVAIYFQIGDTFEALDIASKISSICLNMSPNQISKMKIHSSFDKNHVSSFLKNNDYGFIFLNLVMNYSTRFKREKVFYLTKFLNDNALSSEEEFKTEYLNIMAYNLKNIDSNGNFSQIFIRELLRGSKLASSTDLTYHTVMQDIINSNFNPQYMFADTDFKLLELDKKSLMEGVPYFKELDYNNFYSYSSFLEEELMEFYNACGV